ncbi:DEAD/DEAH box helicase, partial [Phocaeicola vulgatus]
GAPGTRALVPGALIENDMAKTVCLHDYQKDIMRRLSEEWLTHRSVMVQMPTGTGKTHVLAAVVSSFLTDGKRTVWIVAHRRELVAQIEEIVAKYGTSLTDGCIRVMSIQWLTRHYDDVVEKPELVIIDEAHHAQARTYRILWSRCPEAKFLGLTATPCRMGRSGFTDLFDSLICSWSVAEFIRKGWLSSFDYVSIRANSREQRLIDSLEKRGADGDYQIREMNDVLNRHTSIERLYRSVLEYADGKKGIVYAVSIDHARNIAAYYSGKGLDAAAIDSHTPAAERGRMVEDFKTGRVKVLVNVDVFSEGFDCPDVEFVQMARPTLSLAKYLQQAGRGLRKSTGKETCVLIDNVGLYRVFGLPTMAWDWEAMFRGDMAGRGIRTVRHGNGTSPETVTAEDLCQDFGMEMIVSHDRLLSAIALQKTPNPCKRPELRAWHDKNSGLWGLCRGRNKITAPVFVTVFDIRHDMAAVRLSDKNCGLVNACGEIIRKEGYCQSMKFMRNNFLTVQKPNGRSDYIDLYNLRSYREKPEVKRFGDVEMLKVGRMYYSRTKNLYASKLNLSGGYIYDHKFSMWRFLIIMLPSNAILTIRIWLVFHGDMPVSSVVIMTVTIGYADGWRMEASS